QSGPCSSGKAPQARPIGFALPREVMVSWKHVTATRRPPRLPGDHPAMLARLGTGLVLVLPLILPVPKLSADDSDLEREYAERILKDARVPTDSTGLLAFLQSKTLSDADRERVRA